MGALFLIFVSGIALEVVRKAVLMAALIVILIIILVDALTSDVVLIALIVVTSPIYFITFVPPHLLHPSRTSYAYVLDTSQSH